MSGTCCIVLQLHKGLAMVRVRLYFHQMLKMLRSKWTFMCFFLMFLCVLRLQVFMPNRWQQHMNLTLMLNRSLVLCQSLSLLCTWYTAMHHQRIHFPHQSLSLLLVIVNWCCCACGHTNWNFSAPVHSSSLILTLANVSNIRSQLQTPVEMTSNTVWGKDRRNHTVTVSYCNCLHKQF